MKEINLGTIIAQKRHEKGITQEELAASVGVTKASVSKWETGISYPDVTMLPLLAAYFDTSIDNLMGYSPQLEKHEINELCGKLAANFAEMQFEQAFMECETAVKKYYSCYPFLICIARLYLNHYSNAESEVSKERMLNSAIRICGRVKENSSDISLEVDALHLQACFFLYLGNGEAVLEMFREKAKPSGIPITISEGALVSAAHQILGNTEKAKEALQIELYQNILSTLHTLINTLDNSVDNIEVAKRVYVRAEALVELFNVKKLYPNGVIMLYFLGAKMYQMGGFSEKAIGILSECVDICVNGFFPVTLRGDDFFDKIDRLIRENPDFVPKSDKVIKENMMNDIMLIPEFEPLRGNPEYERLVKKLDDFLRRE